MPYGRLVVHNYEIYFQNLPISMILKICFYFNANVKLLKTEIEDSSENPKRKEMISQKILHFVRSILMCFKIVILYANIWNILYQTF